MEPDLYWQCDCGHTNVTAPSAFKRTGSAAHVCSECEQPSQLTRANCTTERRVPVGTQLPPNGTIIGGEPGVEYVFAPTHDSGVTVTSDEKSAAIANLTAELANRTKERDEARAEVERLATVTHGLGVAKEAVEQHNEELRAEVEALTGKVRLLEAGRDERDARILSLSNCALGLRAEVERLKGEEWRTGIVREENAALRARIAALEAVIKAQTTYNTAALDLRDAWDAAGLDASVVTGARVTEDK